MKKEKILLANRKVWDSLSGQTLIESTFSMIVIVMLLLGMVKVFYWIGADLSSRRAAHENTLTQPIDNTETYDDNYRQIRPIYYQGTPMDATTFDSDIFGSNRIP